MSLRATLGPDTLAGMLQELRGFAEAVANDPAVSAETRVAARGLVAAVAEEEARWADHAQAMTDLAELDRAQRA